MTRTVNRAARLELKATLDLAKRAANLLQNKEEALQRERTRLEGYANRAAQQWHQRCREAATWLIRARALGASNEVAALRHNGSEIRDSENDGRAEATIAVAWQGAMGVTYPGDVSCVPGSPAAPITTSALVPATSAYQLALTAGAEHAAAAEALHRVEAELSNTRRRRRAIEERLQPRLETQLHQLDLDLDERDRDAAVLSRLATRERRGRP